MESKAIAVVWRSGPLNGTLSIESGTLGAVRLVVGTGRADANGFSISSSGACRLELEVRDARLGPGSVPTRVTIGTQEKPFTFFLRDVCAQTPIFVPAYGVAVTEAADGRLYDEIEQAVRARGLQTMLDQIASEPEESFENAAAHTRSMRVPTWLGLSRDMRLFEVVYHDELGGGVEITPRFHGEKLTLPDWPGKDVRHSFCMGRGIGCVSSTTRWLEDGCLPILHSTTRDEDVIYSLTAFASPEQSALTAATLRGTHFLVADGHGVGHMFTEAQQGEFDRLRGAEEHRDEEVVLCVRAEAANAGAVPRYAWFKSVRPHVWPEPEGGVGVDGTTGFSRLGASGPVFCVTRLNGAPMPQSEVAILLQPGEKAVVEFFLPHQPLPAARGAERAAALAESDFDERHAECRAFWLKKLDGGARISVPETVVDEMVKAGLLHLELVAYGLEPDGTIAPTVGVYSPIGSESAPIVQFLDSMGRHDVARRALGYFLEKQHDDGFMQNFGGYMLETGPALWSMGEHYRRTRDDAWVRAIKDKLVKACEYMLAWRRRNMREELRGRGYGLQEGKVGDPPDPFHSFMLNGYACLGMGRVAEMIEHVDPDESRRWAAEAALYKTEIRSAFFGAMARSPVVPLGDGSWVPSVPPWAEGTGPVALYAEPGEWFTHGAFLARDSLVGAVYLILQEVLEPGEEAAEFLLGWHAELACVRNVGLSQPYYCRHDFAHLQRGEVKAFLKTYYNGFTGLADRETYTWWEHYHHVSPHKTHEEGWFLMQTRWMLWMEHGETLRLLAGVPRAWLEHGKRIELRDVATYFGPASLTVRSLVDDGAIEAGVECPGGRRPRSVLLRLPHPRERRPRRVEGGEYDERTETVRIDNFGGAAKVTLRF
jgi:hypothetical protein